MANPENILKMEDGSLVISLDHVIDDSEDILATYQENGRYGFSYQPFGSEIAKKAKLREFLNATLDSPESLTGLRIVCTKEDIGLTTTFLRGLLAPVLEFSSFENWSSNFVVAMNGRYKKASDLAAIAFAQGNLQSGEDYLKFLVSLKQNSPSHYQAL